MSPEKVSSAGSSHAADPQRRGFCITGSELVHGWLSRTCEKLTRIAYGRAAEDLIDDIDPSVRQSLLRLPVWVWTPPDAKVVGRKASIAPGRTAAQLLPIRVEFLNGPLSLAGESDFELPWQAQGMGAYAAGTIAVCRDDDGCPSTAQFGLDPADHVTAMASSIDAYDATPANLTRELRRLIDDGKLAHWEFFLELEALMRDALMKAHIGLRNHLTETVGHDEDEPLLDDISLETLLDDIAFTPQKNRSESYLQRLIDKCLDPVRFVKVDPQRWLRVEISRKAGAEIQRCLDDPTIGRKIRKTFSESPGKSIDEVLETYHQQYPEDRLSTNRLARALLVQPDPNAGATRIDTTDGEPFTAGAPGQPQ